VNAALSPASQSNKKQSCCPESLWGFVFFFFLIASGSAKLPNAGMKKANAALIGKY